MWDLSNQFVAEGESGGLVTFVCFIVMISQSFSRLGKMRKQVEGDQNQEWFFWSLCAVMLAHVFAYFGVSYWDQMRVWWWAFLAMISAATVALQAVPASADAAELEYGFFGEPAPKEAQWNTSWHSSEV
jgi:hypothetical protein